MRTMLREFSARRGLRPVDTVHASDFLDDGSEIRLGVTIDRQEGCGRFDFTGTSCEIYGNLNAPPAVTCSAVLTVHLCIRNMHHFSFSAYY